MKRVLRRTLRLGTLNKVESQVMKKTKQIRSGILHLTITVIGLLSVFAPAALHADEKIVPNKGLTTSTPNIEDKHLAKLDSSVQTDSSTGQTKKSYNLPLLTNPWIALATVLIIIIGGAWLVKRIYPGGNMLFGSLPILQVLGRTHLSSKQTLVMIKVDNKLLLLGMTDHQITPLMTIDSPEEVSHLLTQIEQSRPASITTGFKHFFTNENTLLQQESPAPTSV
jgi:flagellar biogenesis protein FliO